MLVHIAKFSLPLPHFLSSGCSYAQISLSSRSHADILRPHQIKIPPIRCSISQVDTMVQEKRPALKWSSLYLRISTMDNPDLDSAAILSQWDEQEKRLTKWVLFRVTKELRKFRRFKQALEVHEWMIAQGERFKFTSADMAIQLDLISKVHGISHAEEFFSTLPDELKDRRTYGALLNAYSKSQMKEKAEALIETMKSKSYVNDSLPFNVMMTLYMNIGEHDKVNTVIDEMKKMNIGLDAYSYNIWITNCAAMDDLDEMERVLERMISDNSINPNWTTYSTLATMYIKAGNFEKVESFLKELELRVTGEERAPFQYLIGHYCTIGKKEEVYRIWKWYRSSFPSVLNMGYQIMLSSLVKLEDTNGAEAIYEEWLSTTSNYDPRICDILMGHYARHGLVLKAKALFDQLIEKGGKPRAISWEILAEGYIKEKQISEALSCMKNAALLKGGNKWRPKPVNIANIVALCREMSKMEDVDVLIDILRDQGCLEDEDYKSLINT